MLGMEKMYQLNTTAIKEIIREYYFKNFIPINPTIPPSGYILDRNVWVWMSKGTKNWRQWETFECPSTVECVNK